MCLKEGELGLQNNVHHDGHNPLVLNQLKVLKHSQTVPIAHQKTHSIDFDTYFALVCEQCSK